jgi:hypothetical protein
MSSRESLNLKSLVSTETARILKELFDTRQLPDEERREQAQIARAIKDRGVGTPTKSGQRPVIQQREADAQPEAEAKSKPEKSSKAPSELEKQTDAKPAAEKPKDGKGEEGGKGGGTAGSEKFEMPEPEELSNPSFDKFKEALALLRGGHSANDADVSKALNNYYNQLSSGDRQSIYAFFFGVAQILAKKASSKEALDPQQALKMAGAPSKPAGGAPAVEPARPASTAVPAGPIVVGEAANKRAVLEIIKSNQD